MNFRTKVLKNPLPAGSHLVFCWIRINLTHVTSGIILLYMLDMERPSIVSIMGHDVPIVVGHHVRVICQNYFVI